MRQSKKYFKDYNRKHKKQRKAYAKKYHLRNKKRINATTRAWYRKNKKRALAGSQRRYRRNKKRRNIQCRAWHRKNKVRSKINNLRWKKKNPQLVKTIELQRLYGITEEEFSTMRKAQKSCCAICKTRFKKTPFVDHDHRTGAVRGLLCLTCNSGLGMFKDSSTVCKLAAAYLERQPDID